MGQKLHSPPEQLPIKERIYMQTVKDCTLLSHKLFKDEQVKRSFSSKLMATVHVCHIINLNKVTGHDKAVAEAISLHESIIDSAEKLVNVTYPELHSPVFRMLEPTHVLYLTFLSYKSSSFLSDEQYEEVVKDWGVNNYVRLKILNDQFLKYIIDANRTT